MYGGRWLCLCAMLALLCACGGGGGGGNSGNVGSQTAVGAPESPSGGTPEPAPADTPDDAPPSDEQPEPPAEPDPPAEPGPVDPPPDPAPSPEVSAAQAVQFLTRATFGATEADILAVMEDGFEAWMDRQLALPVSRQLPLLELRLAADGLTPLGLVSPVAHLQNARMDTWWELAVRAPDQLRQRMAFALSEIFVISDQDMQLARPVQAIASYHDMLAEHAFGNYRALLEAVTLHPAMGTYLSMRRNEKADPASNIRPDENFAREIMQLFSIGLVMLNPDGSAQTDERGQPIPTYGQEQITEFARVYTGWNFFDTRNFANNVPPSFESYTTPMRAFEAFHDSGSKILLQGQVVPAGLSAADDLDAALDIIFRHPNVAPFISRRLIQRLVTSNPTSGYVERVAAVFADNGEGERGDLAAVLRAILLDPEAFQAGEQLGGAKLKEPLLRLTQLWRAFDARGVQGVLRYSLPELDFGQRPYGSPTVFNFFSPSYARPGQIAGMGLVSPEFEIVNEATVTSASNRLRLYARSAPMSLSPNASNHQIELDLSEELEMAGDVDALLDHLNRLLLGGTMPDTMREAIASWIGRIPVTDDGGLFRVREAIALIVTSPEYAVQR